jgi:hypothetical protein
LIEAARRSARPASAFTRRGFSRGSRVEQALQPGELGPGLVAEVGIAAQPGQQVAARGLQPVVPCQWSRARQEIQQVMRPLGDSAALRSGCNMASAAAIAGGEAV